MLLRSTTLAVGLAISSLAIVQPALAQPAAAQVDPELKAACDELALALLPDESLETQVDQTLQAVFTQLYRSEPSFPKLEAAYPGLKQAMIAGVRPVMLKAARQARPLYRADLSALYQANLTTKEAREATAFVLSPEMQAFKASAERNMTYKNTTAAALQDKDVTTEEVQADVRIAANKTAGEVTPKQLAVLKAFFASPAGQKMRALAPQKNAIDTKWVNYSTPELEKEIELAMIDAMINHIAKTDPKTAKAMRAELKPDGTLPD
jgi:hypothetical protein